jgi:uncharacterized protein YciI
MSITVISNTDASKALLAPELAESEVNSEKDKSLPVADKAAEQTNTTGKDAVEKESDERDEEESEETESGLDSGAEDSDKDKPKKKSGSQRRKERAERAEAEVARLQKLVEEMALKGAGASKDKRDEGKSDATESEAEPNPDDFDTNAEYVRAEARWAAKQERLAAEAEQRKLKLK